MPPHSHGCMDPGLFPIPVAPHLLCPACGRVMRDPVLHATCGHSFCRACLSAGASVCPNDGETLTTGDAGCTIPNLTLNDGINKLKVRCPYHYRLAGLAPADTIECLLARLARPLEPDEDGCQVVVALGDLDSHLQTCPNRLVACTVCTAPVRASQLRPGRGGTSMVCSTCDAAAAAAVTEESNSAADSNAAADAAPLPSLPASNEVNGDASDSLHQQQQPTPVHLTRDQLRTMLANQRRLEDSVASAAARLDALVGGLSRRLDQALEASSAAAAKAGDVRTRRECQQQQQLPTGPTRDSAVSAAPSDAESTMTPTMQSATTTATEWTMPFTLTCTGSFPGHTAPIVHLAALPGDDSILYSFALDGEIRALDAVARRIRDRVAWPEAAAAGARLTSACVAEQQQKQQTPLLLVGSGAGCVARVSPWPSLRILDCVRDAHPGPVSAMRACPERGLLLTVSQCELRAWRLAPRLTGLRHVTSLQRDIGDICLSPGAGAATLAVACKNRLCLFGVGDVDRVGDAAEEMHVLSLTQMVRKNFGVPYCLAASRRHVVVGTAKTGVWLFDAQSGLHHVTSCLGSDLGPVRSLACSLSGNWLLTATLDGGMQVWDVRGQRQVQKTRWHSGPVHCLLLLGDTVYSGSSDMDIKVFKYTNHKMMPPIYHQITSPI